MAVTKIRNMLQANCRLKEQKGELQMASTSEHEYPDSYLSEDLPVPEWKKELYRAVYGKDMNTQPLCPRCGRPMYYSLNKRTGAVEISCEACGTKGT